VIELEPALKSLTEHQVDFIIVGELAAYFYGWKTVAAKLEIYYLSTPENLKRIGVALAPHKPRLRGFSEDLPFFWDKRTLQNGTNFTLDTELGDIDLLGEVSGVGNYQNLAANAVEMQICGISVRVISLDDLISAKRAAGRTKDLLVLPELEALREALSKAD
jgi:predicted nucleotidyltransferase